MRIMWCLFGGGAVGFVFDMVLVFFLFVLCVVCVGVVVGFCFRLCVLVGVFVGFFLFCGCGFLLYWFLFCLFCSLFVLCGVVGLYMVGWFGSVFVCFEVDRLVSIVRLVFCGLCGWFFWILCGFFMFYLVGLEVYGMVFVLCFFG